MKHTMRKTNSRNTRRMTALFLAVTMLMMAVGTISAESPLVVVTITGHSGTFAYDGAAKTVSGYDVLIVDPLYTVNDFQFIGNANVSGTDAGAYPMQLTPENFVNINPNFPSVQFFIMDGTLTITAPPVVEAPPAPPAPAPVVEEKAAAPAVIEVPVVEEPAAEEPTAEEPATEEPAAEEPVVEEPAAEEPAAEEPAAEEPAAEEPAAEEPAAGEPSAEEPATEEPAAEAPAAEEPAAEEPAAEEPIVEEPAAEEPVVEEPAAEEPAAEEPATEEPVVEEPTAEEPAAEEPVVEEPATEDPAAEEPAAEEPVVEEPAVEEPVTDEPVAEEEIIVEDALVTGEEPAAGDIIVEEPTVTPVVLYTAPSLDAEILMTLDSSSQLIEIGREGDWAIVDFNGTPGYILSAVPQETEVPQEGTALEAVAEEEKLLPAMLAADDEPPIETDEPSQTIQVPRSVKITSTLDTVVNEGDIVTMIGILTGFDDVQVLLQWQFNDGSGWNDIQGAVESQYSYIASYQTVNNDWRLRVTVAD